MTNLLNWNSDTGNYETSDGRSVSGDRVAEAKADAARDYGVSVEDLTDAQEAEIEDVVLNALNWDDLNQK